jgi:hypothetical protein
MPASHPSSRRGDLPFRGANGRWSSLLSAASLSRGERRFFMRASVTAAISRGHTSGGGNSECQPTVPSLTSLEPICAQHIFLMCIDAHAASPSFGGRRLLTVDEDPPAVISSDCIFAKKRGTRRCSVPPPAITGPSPLRCTYLVELEATIPVGFGPAREAVFPTFLVIVSLTVPLDGPGIAQFTKKIHHPPCRRSFGGKLS